MNLQYLLFCDGHIQAELECLSPHSRVTVSHHEQADESGMASELVNVGFKSLGCWVINFHF